MFYTTLRELTVYSTPNYLKCYFFQKCFVDHASRYNRVKKTQFDAQLILSIFRQTLHVSGVTRPIIRR